MSWETQRQRTYWSRDAGLQPCQGRAEMGTRRHLGPDGGRGISLYVPFLTQVLGGWGASRQLIRDTRDLRGHSALSLMEVSQERVARPLGFTFTVRAPLRGMAEIAIGHAGEGHRHHSCRLQRTSPEPLTYPGMRSPVSSLLCLLCLSLFRMQAWLTPIPTPAVAKGEGDRDLISTPKPFLYKDCRG